MKEFVDHFKAPKFWANLLSTALTVAVATLVANGVNRACQKNRP